MLGKDKALSLKVVATVLSGLGAAVMAYLTRLHFSESGSSVCDISAELSCDIVNKSLYSEILGVPVAVLGLLYFLTVPYLLWAKPLKKPWRAIVLFSTFSLVFSAYLSVLEQLVINSVCLFCEGSKLVMIAILAVSAYAVKHEKEELPAQWIVGAVLVGLLFSGAAWLLQREPEPEKDYAAVAACLTDRGVHMYGAYWCPSCAKQKRDFGKAFEAVSYIECDARGENAEPQRCIERDIRKTPTWVQETEDGEVQKRLEGVHSPETLASEFGCEDSVPQ